MCVDGWLIANRTCPNCKDDLLVSVGMSVRGVLRNVAVEVEPVCLILTYLTYKLLRATVFPKQSIADGVQQ